MHLGVPCTDQGKTPSELRVSQCMLGEKGQRSRSKEMTLILSS